MNEPVRIIARFTARPEQQQALSVSLSALIEPTRRESGCLRYELWHNQSFPADFTFIEEWASEAALEAHMRTPHLAVLFQKLLELDVAEPEVFKYTALGSACPRICLETLGQEV
jgi:quinol monooxygenase YgiN